MTTKITITKADGGIGVLTKTADGTWDIEINGVKGASTYYTQDQVDRIVAKAKTDGHKVEEQ